MEIRLIKPEEAIDYHKISAASFIWKFDKDVDNKVEMPVLGAFQDGKLIAGMELFDFKCNYCGNLINTLVLSGICSQPEYRRMGGVRALFDQVGRAAVENNIVAGFLSPFSIEYYEKFGFANLNRCFTIKVPFHKLQNIPRSNDVELFTGEQLQELCELHNKCVFKENLMTIREDEKHFCKTPLEEADYTYIHRNPQGEADGYVRFKVNRPEQLVAEELFVLTPDALKGIIGFLRNYDGIVKTLKVKKQYQGSPLSCLVDRIDSISYDYEGGYAGRIYNLKKLLENNAYPKEYGKFSILSLDDLEQNKGIFDVEYENGKATVTRRVNGDYDISLTPTAAARLLLAGEGHTAQTAVYIDGVELKDDAEAFFRAFPHRATRFTDSFWSI
ncbi:MAG: GNAT family N-acetyltransferase [Clostridia bacterium]|nr:GNAT family N-acetyltransferase [Clostridia bacterium]